MTIVQVLGVVLMVVGVVSLVVLLWQDLTKKTAEFRLAGDGFDWAGLIGKLPARYLPSAVSILLGYAMFDPAGFKAIFALG